jgi:hypothetical protein
MPAGASSWAISGAAGSLRAGSRAAASFGRWVASSLPDGRWRIEAQDVTPDPYWLENGSAFRGVLTMGRGDVRGPATVVSLEPLVFDMTIGSEG